MILLLGRQMDNDERASLRYIVNTADGAASRVDLMRGWVLLPNRESSSNRQCVVC